MIHCPKGIFKGADTYLLKYVPGVLKSAIQDSSLHTELLAIQKKCIDIAQHRHKQWHFFRKLGVSNSHLEKIIFVLQNSSRQWFKLSQLEKKKKNPIVTAVLKLREEKQITNWGIFEMYWDKLWESGGKICLIWSTNFGLTTVSQTEVCEMMFH